MRESDKSGEDPLVARRLAISVPGRHLVRDLDLTLATGEFVALLGRNGSGKTLTLRTLSGLRPAERGDVFCYGRRLPEYRRPEIARHLTLLPQDHEDLFPSTVLEEALIGRHPHIDRWRWESQDDQVIVLSQLERMGLGDFTARDVDTLSGGERRRLAIARALIQQPSIFLLDEPTNHLDPHHQLQALQVVRDETRRGATALVSLHDVNLAERFADRCLLLHGDGEWQLGATADVLDPQNLSRLYRTPMAVIDWHGGRLFTPGPSDATGPS